MKDILLDKNGDIVLRENGDIEITDSIRQAVKIRLQWFKEEWRFAPEYGLPYFQYVFVKNADKNTIKSLIRQAISDVDEIIDVKDIDIQTDNKTRKARVSFTAYTAENSFREELLIDVD